MLSGATVGECGLHDVSLDTQIPPGPPQLPQTDALGLDVLVLPLGLDVLVLPLGLDVLVLPLGLDVLVLPLVSATFLHSYL